jgi:hypothetical protein
LPAGRLARWALLACTLVGLAAMHSLGHDAGAHATTKPAQGQHAVAMTADADRSAGDCPGDGCTRLSALPGGGGEMAGWGVCLAIVGGFAVVLLVAAARRIAGRRDDPAGALLVGSGAGPRAPPGLLPAGLTLATVSVLRR